MPIFGALTAQRRRLLIAVAAVLAIALTAVVIATIGEGSEAQGTPVLLVHGYGGTAESLAELKSALEEVGRTAVLVQLPDNGRGDIDDSARVLADAVANTGAEHVDLVGFSAGGVVVRSFLRGFGGNDVARRVVLLGAPNHGAQIAAAATAADPESCVDACAQLNPGSSFLSELNAGDETPPGADYTSIWTAFDETVEPPESAVLAGAVNIRVQDVCPNATLSHGDLVEDPIAVGLAIEALAGRTDNIQCAGVTGIGESALRT
jgi:triacylglycerol lipase